MHSSQKKIQEDRALTETEIQELRPHYPNSDLLSASSSEALIDSHDGKVQSRAPKPFSLSPPIHPSSSLVSAATTEALPLASTSSATTSSGFTTSIAKRQKILDMDELPDPISSESSSSSSSSSFSSLSTIFDESWNSSLSSASDFNLLLPNFALFSPSNEGNQTLVLQLIIPTNSNGWALNICPATAPEDDLHLSEVLFHFNPRYAKKMLVMTDRQGTWGVELRRPLGDNRFGYACNSQCFTVIVLSLLLNYYL